MRCAVGPARRPSFRLCRAPARTARRFCPRKSRSMTEGRPQLDGTVVLAFASHVRFRFDEIRKAWVVLAPERLLLPDEQAVEILRLIDGERDIDTIIDELAGRFD